MALYTQPQSTLRWLASGSAVIDCDELQPRENCQRLRGEGKGPREGAPSRLLAPIGGSCAQLEVR